MEPIPVYKKALKAFISNNIGAAAVLTGVLVGNVYQPAPQLNKMPVELTYMNDAALESVDLLSNN